jgi:serine/threonine-protein kinase
MTGERTKTQSPAGPEPEGMGRALCAGCGAPELGLRCEACGAVCAAGGYRAIRVIHQSPHSRVYLAQGPGGERVALKELLFATAPDAKALDDFAREGALLRQLHHPGIPRFVASFREGQGAGTRFYLAQEFVEGRPLLALLEDKRFTADEVRALAEQLLEVLGYLQGLSPPVLHRDLKPANLILRPDGKLVLVDFGSAREVKPGGTHRATLAGTFGYLPPEALGGSVDQTTDLYALGATLLQLLSRRPPEELLWSVEGTGLGAAVNAPPRLLAWLSRLTAARRGDRFQSVAQALQGLHAPETPQPLAPIATAAAAPPEAEALSPPWGPLQELGHLFGSGVGMPLGVTRQQRFQQQRLLLSVLTFGLGAGGVALAKWLIAVWLH